MARKSTTKAKAVSSPFQADEPIDPFKLQTIYCGDNLEKLSRMPSNSVDLIYIDPPFNSNRNYEVFWPENSEVRRFEDRHESTVAYIDFMRPRCREIWRILRNTGSFYYHCDWHACHYVKVMLDGIFGENNFLNEIIWKRTSSHSGSRRFGPVHDNIYSYSKSQEYTWNRQYATINTDRKMRHDLMADDKGRMYRLSDLTGSGTRNGDSGKPWRDYDPTVKGRHWGIPGELSRSLGIEGLTISERLDALDAAGLLLCPDGGSLPRYKSYVEDDLGMTLGSVWTDIPPINSQAAERIGYPTQKPLPLLERIIGASSNPDDIILDAFCGCGTALEAAQRLDRRWIGIDISPTACRVMSDRLKRECKLTEGRDFFVRDLPKTAEQLRAYPHFEFENWAVNALNTVLVNGRAIPNKVKVNDKGIDGRIYPIRADKVKGFETDLFGPTDDWLPIQVKQVESVTRDEVDKFYGAMKRQRREKGFFISFDFSSGALKEMKRLHEDPVNGLEIIPLTVDEILAEEVRYRV